MTVNAPVQRFIPIPSTFHRGAKLPPNRKPAREGRGKAAFRAGIVGRERLRLARIVIRRYAVGFAQEPRRFPRPPMTHDFFSTAQMFGHATLMLSMVTFSRKRDRQFKLWLTLQNLCYATHLFLMGNLAGMAGTLLSATRNLVSLRTRSMRVALVLVAVNVMLAFWLVKAAWNLIPLTATAIATVSMFRLSGLRLRYAMFVCTLFWLINNLLTGSISGTVMESVIAVMSAITIYRLHQGEKERAAAIDAT